MAWHVAAALLGMIMPSTGLMINSRNESSDVHEATLRVANFFSNGFAAESMTSTCRRIPFQRASHADYVRFWHPHELDSLDASMQLRWFNDHERAYGDIFHSVLNHSRHDPRRFTVIDVGSNNGWYASFGAMRGYNVTAIDMQPECNRRARCASVMNRVAHRIEFHTAYAADSSGVDPMEANGAFCCSWMSTTGKPKLGWDVGHLEWVQPLHLGRLVARQAATSGKRVAIMKVDIEGGEVFVMRSLAETGSLQYINHMVVEYSPHMWDDLNVTAQQGQEAFAPLFDAGFVAVDVPEFWRINPSLWRVNPATGPGLPVPGSENLSRILHGMAELEAYTHAVYEIASKQRAVYSLWFFRPDTATV